MRAYSEDLRERIADAWSRMRRAMRGLPIINRAS
jgi:hypothetical protein